jgi:predicted phosphohydrolase
MAVVKLALTSDLYLGVTPPDRLAAMLREMADFGPDAVVVAGDLAESLADLTRCLKLLRQNLTAPIYVLPGDHDFWARPPYDSSRLYRELIPQAVVGNGCHWLEGAAFVVEGVAVAGCIGWYDYSAASMAGMLSDLEFAQKKYMYNADALRIDWEWSDPEFAGLTGGALLATLDQLEENPDVAAVVVVTHFPVLEQQLDRTRVAGFASAYAGNLSLGRKVLQRRKVSYVVSGHAHIAREATLAREGLPPVQVRVLPGDYEKPAWLGLCVSA